jgi:hypothetical protein
VVIFLNRLLTGDTRREEVILLEEIAKWTRKEQKIPGRKR